MHSLRPRLQTGAPSVILGKYSSSSIGHRRNLSLATGAAEGQSQTSSYREAPSGRPQRNPRPSPRLTALRNVLATDSDLDKSPLSPARAIETASIGQVGRRDGVSPYLTDSFARTHNYLRFSLTERCNLRCTYCMPAAGIPLSATSTQLTTPEIVMLSELFVHEGVTKIRLTGGEPTVRRDIVPLVHELGKLMVGRRAAGVGDGLHELCITSNGVALGTKIEALHAAGLNGVNLSLDTLNQSTFEKMTRRPGAYLDKVLATLQRILAMNRAGAGIRLKVNVVLMRGVNEHELLDFVALGQHAALEVRFIEYMPFDGNAWARHKMLPYADMVATIRAHYPDFRRLNDSYHATSKTFQVPGFAGTVGFITSMTENFCAGCNRLRITSDGNLKVCLFGNAEVSLRDLLRQANHDEPIDQVAWQTIRTAQTQAEAGITGLGHDREQALLEVIGAAVQRKKERHAGMDALETMKNRPMILIGG